MMTVTFRPAFMVLPLIKPGGFPAIMCLPPARHTGANIEAAAQTALHLLLTEEQEHLAVSSLGCEVVGRAGEGHYGSVLLASSSGGDVAIKIAPHPSETLAVEATVLRAMSGQPGFPELHSLVDAAGGSKLDALVMERLGPSLHDVWEKTTSSTALPGARVLHLGRSMLESLRHLHAAGFVHNDIKPNNVLLGRPGPCAELPHLIDFGLATSADGSLGGQRGTPLFASIAAHAGEPTRPVHDVESLVYCLAYLASGRLPWERKPASRAAFMKRRMLTDGCSTLMDSCEVDRLTEDVHAAETAEALQLVWSEVVAAHEAQAAAVDYDACLRAFGPSARISATSARLTRFWH